MWRKALIFLGGVWGVGLLVLALWAWRNNEEAASFLQGHNRAVVAWAVRCAAVALIAAGEAVLGMLVIGNLWRHDLFTRVLVLSAALVFMLSTASAVALGLAGR